MGGINVPENGHENDEWVVQGELSQPMDCSSILVVDKTLER